jgi:hypothetical protein
VENGSFFISSVPCPAAVCHHRRFWPPESGRRLTTTEGSRRPNPAVVRLLPIPRHSDVMCPRLTPQVPSRQSWISLEPYSEQLVEERLDVVLPSSTCGEAKSPYRRGCSPCRCAPASAQRGPATRNRWTSPRDEAMGRDATFVVAIRPLV